MDLMDYDHRSSVAACLWLSTVMLFSFDSSIDMRIDHLPWNALIPQGK